MLDPPSEGALQAVTQILQSMQTGERSASSELLPLVYQDLRKLAAARMARMTPGHTLQATALVHEAYVRLVGSTDPGWQGRAHFFGAAARAMRNVLADHLQRKGSIKRGGRVQRVGGDAVEQISDDAPGADMLVVEEVLEQFEREYPRKAEIVTLRFFGGLDTEEIAEVMSLSPRTIERDWQFAKAWLNSRLAEDEAS